MWSMDQPHHPHLTVVTDVDFRPHPRPTYLESAFQGDQRDPYALKV